MKNQSICIIGGGGFIGTALRQYLASLHYDVLIIGRSVNIPIMPNETYYSVVEYSFRQLEELTRGKNIAAVIDLAYTSVPGTSYEDPIKDFSENLYNVIRHLDYSIAVKAKKFIYVSSGGTVYGESKKEAFSEDAANFPLSPYGITKLACERYVHMYHRLHNLPTIIVRPSNIYGPGQKPFRGQGLISTAFGLATKGEPIHIFGDGLTVRDYLYIDDFCESMLLLVEGGLSGEIYNSASGEAVSIKELLFAIDTVVRTDEYSLRLLSQPERPFDVHYNVLNIDKINSQTGWKPTTPLQEGLTRTWEWIRTYMSNHL